VAGGEPLSPQPNNTRPNSSNPKQAAQRMRAALLQQDERQYFCQPDYYTSKQACRARVTQSI
jgi:hypothetical protein